VPDDLTSTAGIVALVAGGLALIELILLVLVARRLRRVESGQSFVLGDSGERDLVGHAQTLQRGFDELHALVERRFNEVGQRVAQTEQRLNHAITHSAVVRYDAYGEMSGRQSSSIALLDDTGTGVIMSSILHREQARLYAKSVRDGHSEFELSPEETEAIEVAQSRQS
jgi:Protein of unknown function (DUF4446)